MNHAHLDPVTVPDPHQRFYESLRARIVNGTWRPGDRIPNRVELRDEFDTSLATMQKALDGLKRDGFVRARGRLGTFVAERLPQQYRVGLAVGPRLSSTREASRMIRALEFEAARINEAGPWEVRVYEGVNEPGGKAQRRVLADARHQCLAGLFIVATPLDAMPLDALREAGLPMIAMTGKAEAHGLPGSVLLPYLDRAVQRIVEARRKRPGIINSTLVSPDLKAWRAELDKHGLPFDAYRAVTALPADGQAVRVAVYHMMQQPKTRRPDALLITDDHMVEPVTKALRDAKVRCPEDVLVIAHCNYPLPPPHHVPVTFIGYDLAEVMDDAVLAMAPTPEAEKRRTLRLKTVHYAAKFGDELPEVRRSQQTVTPAALPAIDVEPAARDYVSASAFG